MAAPKKKPAKVKATPVVEVKTLAKMQDEYLKALHARHNEIEFEMDDLRCEQESLAEAIDAIEDL